MDVDAVKLSPAMIGHDNGISADFTALSIIDIEDSLDDQLAGRDFLIQLDILPVQRRIELVFGPHWASGAASGPPCL